MVEVITQFVQTLIYGLIEGSVISVGAVGLTLSYGVTRFINFAYGEFLTYGAYITLFLSGTGIGISLPLPISAIIGVVLVGVFGVIISRIFFEPVSSRGPIPLLITSIGVAFILRYSLTAAVGVSAQQLPVPLMRPIEFLGVGTTPIRATVFVIAITTMLLVHILLSYTMLGKTMRATSGNRNLAEIAGINTDSVVRKTWFISAGAGALAGVLYATLFAPFRPTIGFEYLIVIFAATLLGGIGRPYGAMAGAVVVGVAMSLGSTYVSAEYTMVYAFAILVGVLLFNPTGIAGSEI
ncbi:branched-chain amino acid ABC transporter permease [Haloquadratum walsbyi]|jgi:Branched-chain amino acid ABC-type transport system, permease components|uniref:Branched-chain amino acid ABC-type transport system, permease component n=1 Tax=Haloquadratum walsbyi J07HQW2 TaxID=1238425 RepID=U1PMK7_9EURY|nr:branched-chain amino acid ABC transporter permease [Haloquadratum walsbyi]ERG94967.1 MAG: branched-chain amino acid ABC-type transport system, permease component [Haloquadratum walsbyi J07HQW2]